MPYKEFPRVNNNPMTDKTIPAIAMFLFSLFIPNDPMIIPTILTKYPKAGRIQAIKPAIPITNATIALLLCLFIF